MLNRRHKTKLKELAYRIRNTEEIRDVVLETQYDATIEIEELLCEFDDDLKAKGTLSTELAVPSSNLGIESIFEAILNDIHESDQENRNFTFGDDEEPLSDMHETPKDSVVEPGWVKKLKREIAKKCHPDKTSTMDLSAAELERRTEYNLRVNDAIANQDWDMVLLIGIYVEAYTSDLPPMNQKRRLTKIFQKTNSNIANLRNTIAYKWSEEWGNTEFKYSIVQMFLEKKGKAIPPKLEAVKKILDWEKKFE